MAEKVQILVKDINIYIQIYKRTSSRINSKKIHAEYTIIKPSNDKGKDRSFKSADEKQLVT